MKTIHTQVLLALGFVGSLSASSQGLSLPYSTGFDNTTETAGWEQYRLGDQDSYDWNMSIIDGNGVVSHDYPVGSAETDTTYDWMVSPALDIPTDAWLSFNATYFYFMQADSDYFGIWISNGSPDPADGDFVEAADLTDETSGETSFEDLPLLITGEEVYIAFVYRETNNWYTIEFDDVLVESQNPDEVQNLDRTEHPVTAYPNPADVHSMIRFTHLPPGNEPIELLVHNTCGELIAAQRFDHTVPVFETANLVPGIYSLLLRSGNITLVNQSLIIQ